MFPNGVMAPIPVMTTRVLIVLSYQHYSPAPADGRLDQLCFATKGTEIIKVNEIKPSVNVLPSHAQFLDRLGKLRNRFKITIGNSLRNLITPGQNLPRLTF